MTGPIDVPSPVVARPDARWSGFDRIELHRVRLVLREPFVTAHGTEHGREVVLVEVIDRDGGRGWGECSALAQPGYSGEDTDGSWWRLRDHIAPAVLAGQALEVGDHPMAWTAMTTALTDRVLRSGGRSLASSVGGTRATVATTAVIGRRSNLDELLAVVAARIDDGVAGVKLKVVPGADVDAVASVRRTFPDLSVAVDANGSFAAGDRDHRNQLVALDRLGLAYVEQPLTPSRPDALVDLARTLDTPVALDESIAGPDDVVALASSGVRFVLNIKPARVGGLDRAAACVAAAREVAWSVFVGGMLETGVGRALALAAASWSACDRPTDLGPSTRYFDDDITAPFELVDGKLVVPTAPGLGVDVRPDRLAATRVDHVVVHR